MTEGARRGTRWSGAAGVVLLAALTYLPALSAGHGRLPADTKLYLYLDPGRLVGDAPYTFDPRQFAGWVPHQTISYLWPSGPWYWLFEQLGAPDWVAHRLWIGTVLFVAGLGVRWCARLLGIASWSAVAAGALYALTPFVLPYLSRTSLMLLPFAGLGWIVGLTVLAATRSTWRHAALLALVLATVAAPNATAIAMVAPAPVLWLVTAALAGTVTWRRAVTTALRIGALGLAVCVWWIAMLSVQGRVGADVLAYSETLEAVSLTSASTETLRGLGYWLFYIRDPVGFATSAAERYMVSARLVALGVAVTGIGLAGLSIVRFAARRFAILLVVVGTTLAIGVHPIDDPAPIFAPFAESSRSTMVLALRSSTRALPMTVLGLALGAGALAAAIGRRVGRGRPLGSTVRRLSPVVPGLAVVALALVNLPAAWTRGFVDANLDRDQDPPSAWLEAADRLDARTDTRVLQVPGQEFGAFRWGYTADPPLPGLTERPLVTRDLLPLGSPGAMDLVYALDDRFQEGTVERASIAPVARLLGASTVWVTNDIWFDRYRSPRPEVTASLFASGGDGLAPPATFGAPAVAEAVVPSIDERSVADPRVGAALEPVWLTEVADPETVVRAKTDTVVVVGSGDGIVDAAAAGLLDGSELLLYAGSGAAPVAPERIVVTDSNRDQARQWRSSQDTRGFTETGGDALAVLRPDPADQRLAVQSDAAQDQTVAIQDGPVTALASAYGEPFAYRPEDRAAMAVDGDPATAWRVADRADATGELIELAADEPVTTVRLLQPSLGATGRPINRWITAVDLSVDGGPSVRTELDERSRSAPGQEVALPAPGTTIRLAVASTEQDLAPDVGPDAVGFAEIDAGLGPSLEVVRLPAIPDDDVPVDVVLTRLRADATDRWRSDPEPVLRRRLDLPAELTGDLAVTIRIPPRASDTAVAAALGLGLTTASERITGLPSSGGWAATDGDPTTAWYGPFGAGPGLTLTVPTDGTTPGELRVRQPGGDTSPITTLQARAGGAAVDVAVPPPDPDGWSTVALDALPAATALELEVTGIEPRTTRDRRSAELVQLPVGISEIVGSGVTVTPLDDVTVPLGCRSGLVSIDGVDVPLDLGRVGLAPLLAGDAVVAGPCTDGPVTLPGGSIDVVGAPGRSTGFDVDRVVVRSSPAGPATPRPTIELVERGRLSRTATVGACPAGCWVVLGEGKNPGWSASLDGGDDLGPATLVDGGFHGWWLPPSAAARTIRFEWGEQRPVTIGLVVSGLAVLGCVVLAVADRRRRPARLVAPPRLATVAAEPVEWAWWAPGLVTGGVALALIGPSWAVAGTVVGLAAGRLGRPRLLAAAAVLVWLAIGAVIAARTHLDQPFPGPGWPGEFATWHRPGVFVLALLAGSLTAPDRRRRVGSIPPS